MNYAHYTIAILLLVIWSCQPKPSGDDNQNISAETAEAVDTVYYASVGIKPESVANIRQLEKGDAAPDFSANDQHGDRIDLDSILTNQSVALVFYRGYWCPYCSKYLMEFSESLEQFTDRGIKVIAISPEKPDHVAQLDEQIRSSISIISDTDGSIMKRYGVAFSVTDDYDRRVQNYKGFSLSDAHDSDDAILPIPATYLIDQDGTIRWAHYDPDYSKRGNLDDLLASLE